MEFPQIDPVVFSIGFIEVRWYALAYLAGFLLGWGYALRLADGNKKERPYKDDIDNFMIWAIPAVIIGGRFGHVFFYSWDYHIANPFITTTILGYDLSIPSMLAVWRGGMSFHGGVLGMAIAMVAYCWKHQFYVFRLSDVIACVAPIGLFFGRIANFVNAELYGRVTDHPFGVVFPGTDGQPRHPSQLYEALLEGLILFIVMFVMAKKELHKKFAGLMTSTFLILYGSFRFIIEYVREPDQNLGLFFNAISMGQILCLPMIIAGIAVFIYAKQRRDHELSI